MKLHGFTPADPSRTTAVRINLFEVKPGTEIIVYGTVLPEKGEANHAAAIKAQSEEWTYLRDAYPKAILCVAGDFNTDMGRAKDYGYPHFFGPKDSTALLVKTLERLRMRTVTDHGFPEGLKPKYPPIDHIALSEPHADQARIVSSWAGRKGDGQTIDDRIGIVIAVR
jgi:endonuclease/exonuclease/phosphatase family metal-dependent hydrolase